MKLSGKITDIFDRVNGIAAVLAAAILLFATLIVSLEVVMRFFFNHPIIWATEITEYGLLFVTFLAAAWVLKKGGHVAIDLVLVRLEPGTKALVNGVTSIICAVVCLVLIWYTAQTTWSHFIAGTAQVSILNIPYAYIIFIIPVGYFLLFIQFLRKIYGYLVQWKASPK